MQYLLRYSEIGTKAAGTRRRMLRVLEANLKDAFAREGISADTTLSLSRGTVMSEDVRTAEVLQRIFGIQSFSPVHELSVSDLNAFVLDAAEFFMPTVHNKRFAVRARRVGSHPFTSQDIERQLGATLLPHAAGVDLTDPEVTCGVEVRSGHAYLFSERIAGPHGLPLGTQNRALVLLSGGFDSAVAAWELMHRGVGTDYCFFNLGGPIHEEGVLRVAKLLTDRWQYGDNASIVVVPFMPVVEMIRERTEPTFWNLVLKQAMLMVAARIAEHRGISVLAAGDAIGQVSSQTLANLTALQDVGMPVLRPLLTSEKDSIIARARVVGTEKLSAAVQEYCAIVPKHPVTAATRATLGVEWEKIDQAALDAASASVRTLSLNTLALEKSDALAEVAITKIPDGARIIDVREPAAFAAWHAPGAERMDIHDAMQKITSTTDHLYDLYKKERKPILFVCEHGLLSAELAQMARQRGIVAASFKGGAAALRDALTT